MPGERNTLLRTQANDIYRWLKEAGGDPRDFDWGDDSTTGTPLLDRLMYLPDPAYFLRINGNDRGEYGERAITMWWRPGVDAPGEKRVVETWDAVEPWIHRWYKALEAQTSAPDLWTMILGASDLIPENSDPTNNSKFSAAEKREIAAKIEAAKTSLLSAGLSEEQLDVANEKLDYLVEASQRVGRFDWRNLAVGIVVDVAVSAAFDPHRAEALLNLVVGAARHLLGA